jgi:nitrate/nitrite transporter NarK
LARCCFTQTTDVRLAAGIATINSIGNLGGFVAPAMIGWIKQETGSFISGLYFVAGPPRILGIPHSHAGPLAAESTDRGFGRS